MGVDVIPKGTVGTEETIAKLESQIHSLKATWDCVFPVKDKLQRSNQAT